MLIKDVKPDNFMVDDNGIVHFIDFGLMERMSSFDSGVGGKFEGTPSYASVAAHDGAPVCRHDDIESLGWVLLALAEKATLPWSHCKSDDECRRMKRECNVRQLAVTRQCEEVGSLILLSRETTRTATPHYSELKKIIERLKNSSSRESASSSTKTSTARQRLKANKNDTSQIDLENELKTSLGSQRAAKRKSSDVVAADTSGPFVSTVGSPSNTKKRPMIEDHVSKSPFTLMEKAESNPRHKADISLKQLKKALESNESVIPIASSSPPQTPFTSAIEGRYPKRKRIATSNDSLSAISFRPSNVYIEVLEGPRAGEKLPISSPLDLGKIITIGRENADVNVHDECISEWYSPR